MVLYGNVHFCINMPREDIFKKEFVDNQNFIFRMFAVKLCWKKPTHLENHLFIRFGWRAVMLISVFVQTCKVKRNFTRNAKKKKV